jgi:hypothetical protein
MVSSVMASAHHWLEALAVSDPEHVEYSYYGY